jgi:integrase
MPTYLQKRRLRWYAVLEIPAALRRQFGKPRFVQSLGTDSLAEAKRKVGRIVGDWMDALHRARTGGAKPAVVERDDPAYWRRLLREAKGSAERDAVLEMIEGHADAVAYVNFDHDTHRKLSDVPEANAFYGTATAIETTTYLEEWLATARTARKTQDMGRSDVKRFAKAFPTLGAVQRPAVRAWVSGLLHEGGLSPKTVARQLGAIRGYWHHLESVGCVEEGRGAFDRLDVARQARREGSREKRQPFAPAEVVKLHDAALAAGDVALADLIALAQWTGCRIEEICSLQIGDVDLTAGSIRVREAKTDAGVRVVPVHSKSKPLLLRLIGQRSEGWLLTELTANKYGDRSNAIGKRFGKLRTVEGFGPEVVFHSIRKTVATLLENAGVPENLAADILGHEKPRITYGLYSGGATLAGKLEAIGKLSYPAS